jgi:hypothetical protein
VYQELVYPEQIDRQLNWPLGTAARLARRKQLPHYLLPDGSIRLCWAEVEALVRHVPLQKRQEGDCVATSLAERSAAISEFKGRKRNGGLHDVHG